jgi:hypothetical protein
MEAILHRGMAAEAGRRRGIPEAVSPLPSHEDVMKYSEVEVRGQGWNGRGGQPLPNDVPRELWVLLLHMRAGRIHHPVLVDEGRPGGRQEGRENRRQVSRLQQKILEFQVLDWRLASEEGGILREWQVVLEGSSHPVGEVEGRAAAGRQLMKGLLGQQ